MRLRKQRQGRAAPRQGSYERRSARQTPGRSGWPPPWPDITRSAVLGAMAAVPRHLFVPPQHQQRAYEDVPLPIGHGQTISQPYIVALMTQALRLPADSRVLEIGTGSGYQAAVLAQHHAARVERGDAAELAETARERLHGLGYRCRSRPETGGSAGRNTRRTTASS